MVSPSPFEVARRLASVARRFEKILRNAGWLFVSKGLGLLSGLFVTAWVARYLGPEDFGTLRYVMAYAGLFGVFAALGLPTLLVRELVIAPGRAGELLGSALGLRVASGAFAGLVAVAAIPLLRPDDAQILLMISIASVALVVRAAEIMKAWFEYQVLAGLVVRVDAVVLTLSAAFRVALVASDAPLMMFAWALLFDACVFALAMGYAYRRHIAGTLRLAFDRSGAVVLLRESWPLMLSAFAIMVYMRIDVIMLGQMRGERDAGIYAVAAQLSEVWYTVPLVVATSVFPRMIGLRTEAPARYALRLRQLLSALGVVALGIAVGAALVSPWLVHALYGADYAQSADVVRLHVWALVFVFPGMIGNRWYIAEGLQTLMLRRTLAGAALNIGLNFVLIPRWGPTGAALATLVSTAVVSWLWDAADARTRPLFRAKTDALTLRWLWFRRGGTRDS